MCGAFKAGENCEKIIGYQTVYRIWFGFFLFFLLLAIITIRVKSSRDPRGGIHKG